MNTETATKIESISFAALPALKAPLADGHFAGITTRADGTHCAVVLLGVATDGKRRNHAAAKGYAESLGGQRAPKAVLSLLFVTCRDLIPVDWYWADEEEGSSYAWSCLFSSGLYFDYRSSEGGAVAVRLIPLTA